MTQWLAQMASHQHCLNTRLRMIRTPQVANETPGFVYVLPSCLGHRVAWILCIVVILNKYMIVHLCTLESPVVAVPLSRDLQDLC
jgi:hypothetical protein